MDEFDNVEVGTEVDGLESEDTTVDTEVDAGTEDDFDFGGDDDDLDLGEDVDDFDSWLADKDKKAVKKTYDKFTQGMQTASQMKKEAEALRAQLAPVEKLHMMIENDPAFAEYLLGYDPYQPQEDEDPASAALRLVQETRYEIEAEKALGKVGKWAEENGFPPVDDVKLLNFAAKNGINDLQAAYQVMHFDEISEAKKDKALADIKKSRNAGAVNKPTPSNKPKKAFTPADMSKMSSQEFLDNYDAIYESFKN